PCTTGKACFWSYFHETVRRWFEHSVLVCEIEIAIEEKGMRGSVVSNRIYAPDLDDPSITRLELVCDDQNRRERQPYSQDRELIHERARTLCHGILLVFLPAR